MSVNMNNLYKKFHISKKVEKNENNNTLDLEWVYLIFAAKSLGIEKNEVREFIQKNSINSTVG